MRANEALFVFHHTPTPADKDGLAAGSAAHVVYRPPTMCNRPKGWHVDVLLYTLRGAARGNVGGVQSRATPGSVWIHPGDRPYSFDIDPDIGYWEGYWIEVYGPWTQQLLSNFRLRDVTHIANCTSAGAVFDQIFDCLRLHGSDGVHEAAGLLWRVLAIAERAHHRSRTQTSAALQAVERAKDYARRNFSTSISLEDMATAASLSSYHFAHLFRKETGSTPMKFVRSLRINFARELLYKGQLSIKQVARASGFANVQHFTNAFKSATGHTPGQFSQALTRAQ